MQQPTPMFPVMPSFPPTNITTEQIQKYLDENKKLILAILDNQNLGKLAECAQYQAQLQKNLMYLAAIADAQPQTPTMPTQMTPHGAMQQGGFYMGQQAAAAGMTFQPRPPAFNSPHPLQDHHPQQHQNNLPQPQGVQMGLRPMGHNNGMNQNNDTNLVPVSNPTLNDIRKQDKPAATSDNSAAAGHGHGGGDVQEPK